MENQNSEISLTQWAGQAASMFLATGERSGKLSEMLRENYTREGIKAVADALIAQTGALTSGDARIRSFGTAVARAVPCKLDADGKPTKIPAVAVLTVAFKIQKNAERGSGVTRKILTAQAIEKKRAEKHLAKECAAATCNALMFAWQADAGDDAINALRTALESVVLALKGGYLAHDMTNEQYASVIAKCEATLSATE